MCEHIISVGTDWDKSKEKHWSFQGHRQSQHYAALRPRA